MDTQLVEKVRKVYARDLRDKDKVHTVFKVTRKNRQTSRNGKVFLVPGLADKTGEVDARIFDGVEQREGAFAQADYVLVQGSVVLHQGHKQVVVEAIEKLDPEPIDAKEFEPPPAAPGSSEPGRAVPQIREIVERVQDPYIKQLLEAFLDDPAIAKGLPIAPAAKG